MWAAEFEHDRRQAIIPVAILHPDHGVTSIERLRGLIDTGASSTAISQEVAGRLDLPRYGRTIVTTPSGEFRATRHGFRIGLYRSVDDALPVVLEDTFLGVAGTPGQNFDVLIGMDVIGRGDLTLRRNGTGSVVFDAI